MANDFRIRRDDPASGAGNNAPAEENRSSHATLTDQRQQPFVTPRDEYVRPTPPESRVSKIGLFERVDPAVADQFRQDISRIEMDNPFLASALRLDELEYLADLIRHYERIPTYVLSNTGASRFGMIYLLTGQSRNADFPFSFETFWHYVDTLPSALRTFAFRRNLPNLSLEIHLSLPTFLHWAAENPEAFRSGGNFFYVRQEHLERFIRFARESGALRIIALPQSNYDKGWRILKDRAARIGIEIVVAEGEEFETVQRGYLRDASLEDETYRWGYSVVDPQSREKYDMLEEAEQVVEMWKGVGSSDFEIIETIQRWFDLPIREASLLCEEALRLYRFLKGPTIEATDRIMSRSADDAGRRAQRGAHRVHGLDRLPYAARGRRVGNRRPTRAAFRRPPAVRTGRCRAV